jgi:peptidoglycan/xylan/chitin deacetylase (PgdA/CDA1 family)
MIFFLFFIPLFLFADAHIFVLHRIDDFRHAYTNTSSLELEKYFKYIKTHGYRAVKLSTLVKIKKEHKPLDKIVVFTIDDSYKSFYKNGLPLFKKYNIPFTLFVYTKATTQKWGDFMSWKQVKECAKYGELGVHSWAHPHLTKLSSEAIRKDTQKAIDVFKKYMGYVPNMYAYPYGEYDNRVKKIISEYFDVIANQNPGSFASDDQINDIDRFALTGEVNIARKLAITQLRVKDLSIVREKNKIIKISGYTDVPYVNVYITKLGWKGVRVKNGYFEYRPEFELKRFRSRVILRYKNKMKSVLEMMY